MRDLPVRKQLRLKGYDYNSNGAYFITVCVKDRHEMLGTIAVGRDAHIAPSPVILSEYGLIVQKYIDSINNTYGNVELNKYVIMPNHIHMIVFLQNGILQEGGAMWASRPTKKAAIPTIVRTMKTLVSKECGFSFWQASYHDHIIRSEDEYQKIWQYIDENPSNWQGDRYYLKPSP